MQFEHITGPEHWASALVNGDSSGLTTADTIQLNAWRKRIGIKNVLGIVDDSERFTWHMHVHAPELEVRGGTVVDYIVELKEQA